MNLQDNVANLKGVGKKRLPLLAKLRIETMDDLVHFFPRRYEDRRQIVPIMAAPIGRDVLIGGSKFAHLKGRRVSLEELKDCSWISLTAETITRNFLNKYFEEHGLQFSPDIELATTDMILPAVRHNLGIGFVPAEIAAEDIRRGTVFEITVAEKLPERHILLVQDTEYPQSIASKAFQTFLSQR